MSFRFELPEDVDPFELDEGMNGSGAIRLPFSVVYFYAVNGSSRLAQIGNASYFGGWGTDKKDLLSAVEEYGEAGPPSGFEEFIVPDKNNVDMNVYHSRSLLIAPIGQRRSWYKEENGANLRRPDYFPGARHHMQLLCYVATKPKPSEIQAWAPAVLTTKGYQVGYMVKALADWKAHLEKVRKAIAPNIPAWCFYMGVGTYGDKPKMETVGKTGAQSQITPITTNLPEISEALLEKLYVGPAVVAQMLAYKAQAKEWLAAWGSPGVAPSGEASQAGYQSDFDNTPPPPETPPDDIPF